MTKENIQDWIKDSKSIKVMNVKDRFAIMNIHCDDLWVVYRNSLNHGRGRDVFDMNNEGIVFNIEENIMTIDIKKEKFKLILEKQETVCE